MARTFHDWSRQEVDATVRDYFDMLASELRGAPYVKAAHNETLRALLDDRTRGAVERKHQNISAVLIELGFPYINGYKPLSNIQHMLRDVVRQHVSSLEDLVKADVEAHQIQVAFDDLLGIGVDPPVPTPASVREAPVDYVVPNHHFPTINYLQMEALNRSLGDAGEALVMEFERARLLGEGKDRLARNVEQVSKTVGDHAGFDIRSYEVSGRDRFIEVKTTRYGKLTPFYISAGEVRFSEANVHAYHLYRLFEFRQRPRFFLLPEGCRASRAVAGSQLPRTLLRAPPVWAAKGAGPVRPSRGNPHCSRRPLPPLTLMSTEEYPFISNIVTTLREFGDATSRNLQFSHRPDVYVSYGEETITGTNLLEIRRRHRDRIFLKMFSKKKEAHNGADWDWHIVGDMWTLKMRVQAKRVQRDDSLKIMYKVKSSCKQQRELLLERADADKMKPLYCIYCTEPQRSFWKQSHANGDFEGCQTGCLLADANDVCVTTTKLDEIEDRCIPWHYLFQRVDFARCKSDGLFSARVARMVDLGDADRDPETTWWKAPTIADLNKKGDGDFDHTGVHETSGKDLRQSSYPQEDHAEISDRGIHRKLVIDVRDRG